MENNYYTCADLAVMTKKTLRTVHNWIKSGKLKATRPTGREYVIRESDFRAFWFGER